MTTDNQNTATTALEVSTAKVVNVPVSFPAYTVRVCKVPGCKKTFNGKSHKETCGPAHKRQLSRLRSRDEAKITAKMKRTEELKAIRKNSDLYRDAMNRYYCKSRRGTTELSICGCGDGFQHNRSFGDGTKIPKPSLNDFPLYLFEDDEELRAERQAEYEERQEAKKRRMRKREEKAAALRNKYPAEEVKPDVPALKANLIVDGKSLYHFEIVEEKNFVGRSTMNVR
jgi:hypothetical protein